MDGSSIATIGDALASATDRLRGAGSPTPRLDAEVLLGHVIGRERSWLLAHPEGPLTDVGAFDEAIERRAGGEPVAYIRGFKEWHALRIRADRRALIPRPETELLADAAVAAIAARLAGGPVNVREVATGSGAVSVVLATRFAAALASGRLTLVASDISTDALALAAENFAAHGTEAFVRLLEADLLEGAGARSDVVIANLPYVASAEVDERRGSLGFEPRVALDGGPDGLELLRRLMAQVPTGVADGATILLEIGIGQVDAIRALAPDGASVHVVPDLAGLDRVVRIEMPRLHG